MSKLSSFRLNGNTIFHLAKLIEISVVKMGVGVGMPGFFGN